MVTTWHPGQGSSSVLGGLNEHEEPGESCYLHLTGSEIALIVSVGATGITTCLLFAPFELRSLVPIQNRDTTTPATQLSYVCKRDDYEGGFVSLHMVDQVN